MKASEIARRTGYEISGRNDRNVSGISYARVSKPGEIAVVSHRNEIATTLSDVVLSLPVVDFSPKTFIFSHDPISVAVVKVAKVLVEAGICPDYGRPSMVPFSHLGYHVSPDSNVGANCVLGIGCIVHGNVRIGENCVIGAHTEISAGVVIGDNVTIGANCHIGSNAFYRFCDGRQSLFCGIGGVRIADQVNIGNNVSIQRGLLADTCVGRNTILGNLIDVGHDTRIGDDCFIVSQTGIAGDVVIGDQVTIYGQVGVRNGIRIGDRATVFARSGVAKDVDEDHAVSGSPALEHGADLKRMAKLFHVSKESGYGRML